MSYVIPSPKLSINQSLPSKDYRLTFSSRLWILDGFGVLTFLVDSPEESHHKYTKEETDSGTELIRDFLDTWKSRVESSTQEMGEEEQVEELRKVAREFGGRLEDNKWVAGLMADL